MAVIYWSYQLIRINTVVTWQRQLASWNCQTTSACFYFISNKWCYIYFDQQQASSHEIKINMQDPIVISVPQINFGYFHQFSEFLWQRHGIAIKTRLFQKVSKITIEEINWFILKGNNKALFICEKHPSFTYRFTLQ